MLLWTTTQSRTRSASVHGPTNSANQKRLVLERIASTCGAAGLLSARLSGLQSREPWWDILIEEYAEVRISPLGSWAVVLHRAERCEAARCDDDAVRVGERQESVADKTPRAG